MYKEIKRVDPARGILQITTVDERFYARDEPNPITGLPEMVFRPSVTWISGFYPKGKGFEIWLKKNGDDADLIAHLAAEHGYKEHRAIAALNEGETVKMGDLFENSEGVKEPLTPEEYRSVMSYAQWWEAEGYENYEILKSEYTLWPNAAACAEKYKLPAELFEFAGTVDLKLLRKKDQTIGIVDMKRSQDIWPAHECQVSAYAKAEGADWRAILQVNYKRNKVKKDGTQTIWKWTEIDDCFDVFAATRRIWKKETAGTKPLQRDFPMELKLVGVDPPKKKESAA